jgi:hypothetical protein
MALRGNFQMTLALLPLWFVTACVPQSATPSMAAGSSAPRLLEETSSQPNTATYSCAGGGMMTIQNLGNSIRLLGPDGIAEELHASPANQTSRYGEAHDAIVIDGREALVMKAGQTPLPCTR